MVRGMGMGLILRLFRACSKPRLKWALLGQALFTSAHERHHDPLDDQFVGGDEAGVAGVFGAEMSFAFFGDERFERAFVVDEGGHDIAGARGEAMFQDDDVAVEDVFADHGIAADLEGESARGGFDADGIDIDGDAAFGLLGAVFREAGRDGAEEGDIDHAFAQVVEGGKDLERAGPARVIGEEALLAKGAYVIDRRAHAAETELLGDLPQAGGEAAGVLAFVNEIEDLPLAFGEWTHRKRWLEQDTVQVNGIKHRAAFFVNERVS